MDISEKRHSNAWKLIKNLDEFHENYNILIDNAEDQREKKRSTVEAEKRPLPSFTVNGLSGSVSIIHTR